MGKKKVKENTYIKMDVFMKGILKMIKRKEMGFFIIQMEIDIKIDIKVYLKMVFIKEMEYFILIMVIDMKENLIKIVIQEMVNIFIIMVINLKVCGKMIKKMVKVFIFI